MHIFCLTSDLFRSGPVFHKNKVYNLDHFVHLTLIYDDAALSVLNEVVMFLYEMVTFDMRVKLVSFMR